MTTLQLPTWQALCAFGFGPLDPTPVFTDVTQFMRSFTTQEGRQHELDRIEASELQMKLWDALGVFTPANTLSPYYNLLNSEDALGLDTNWLALEAGTNGNQSTQTLWGSTAGYFTGSTGGVTQFILPYGLYTVTPSSNYTFSVWMRAATVGESLNVGITWYDGASAISTINATAITDSTTGWTQYVIAGVSPSNANNIELIINDTASTANTHYFTCAMLSYNPDGVPIGWSQGQSNPFVPGVPTQIKGTWDSDTEDVSYTFADSWTPVATDPLNQDTNLIGYDVLGLLAQAPLSNSLLYPAQVAASGTVCNYWRLNDAIGASVAASYTGGAVLTPAATVAIGFPYTGPYAAPDFGSQDTTGAGIAALLSSSFTGQGSGAILYDTATAATFDTPGFSNTEALPQGLGLPGGESGLADNDPWSVAVLVNFGTVPGSIFLATTTSAGGFGVQLYVENGSAFPDNVGQIVLGYADGNAPGGPVVTDGLWHLLMVTSQGSGGECSVTLDGVEIITISISHSTTPVGDGSTAALFLTCAQEADSTSPTTVMQDCVLFDGVISGTASSDLYEAFHLLQDYDYTGERIEKVLRIVGYESYPAEIDTGTILCQPETTSQTSTAALDYMLTATDTELGFLVQTPDGILRFHNALWALSNPTSNTSQGTLGDSLSADLNYEPNVKIPQDSLDFWPDVQVQAQQGVGVGVMQEVINQAAVGPPGGGGKRVLQRTGLLFATDTAAATQAELLLSRYSTPQKRVDGVTLKAQANQGNNISQMLQRQLWERLTFERQGSRESPFSADMLIEHRSHSYQADPGTYSVTWVLSPYEVVDVSFSIIGVGKSLSPGGAAPSPMTTNYFGQGGLATLTFSSGVATLVFPITFPNGLLDFEANFLASIPSVDTITLAAPDPSQIDLVATADGSPLSGTYYVSWSAKGW